MQYVQTQGPILIMNIHTNPKQGEWSAQRVLQANGSMGLAQLGSLPNVHVLDFV